MIPQIIHYCWFGGSPKPELVERCMMSWHTYMPDWTYMEWNESNFDIASAPLYVRQAYEAKKYAFVSDYARLWALEQYGGVYLDTDVEVIRSFDELPEFQDKGFTKIHDAFTEIYVSQLISFIGFEESKAKTLGTNVIGCEPHCAWVQEMLAYYDKTPFLREDGLMDMTPNSELIARLLEKHGLIRDGKEQVVRIMEEGNMDEEVHVYDYHYFSPITSTRVMRKNRNTFSIHHCYGSWTVGSHGNRIRNSVVVREFINALIQIKRLFEK